MIESTMSTSPQLWVGSLYLADSWLPESFRRGNGRSSQTPEETTSQVHGRGNASGFTFVTIVFEQKMSGTRITKVCSKKLAPGNARFAPHLTVGHRRPGVTQPVGSAMA